MLDSHLYQTRRQQLAAKLPPDSVAILSAAQEIIRNGDAHFRFRQDSDFYYLTGFEEPDALLVITAQPDAKSYLFNRPSNLQEEQWTGPRLGQENACKALLVDEAYSYSAMATKLPELLANKKAVFYHLNKQASLDNAILSAWQQVKGFIRRGITAPEGFMDLAPLLSELRLIKDATEIALLKKAAAISVQAHLRAMKQCSQLHYEYEVEAELAHEFYRLGCRSMAYDPIVAGGKNACILHYTQNNQALNSGELLLIDAGGEYQNYAADITRTFPINGKFSKEQRLIYELVLAAQRAAIAEIKPGKPWDLAQRTIVRILTQGLVELGILKGAVDSLIEQEAYKPFYMHQSGHWLGLDVHDCGQYKCNQKWRALEPGMVLTVEPGLYFGTQLAEVVEERWLGIGVRIEDDILVTSSGHENLTEDLLVKVDDIEAFMCDGC